MKVSIIIVVYNAEKWLEECINSALNQTMHKSEYEILIIDNGSTDDSIQIINEYSCKNNNMKVFVEKENKRLTIMYNKYLKIATGEYVYFLHSDDIMSRDLISLCYDIMHEKDLELVFFGWKSFYTKDYDIEKNRFIVKDKEKTTSIIQANKILDGKEVFKQEQWLGSEFAFVFNRSFIINNNLVFCEKMLYWDLEFPPRILMKAKKVMRIDKILYYYRLRKDYTNIINYDVIRIHIKNTLLELSNLVKQQDKSDKRLMDSFKIYFNNMQLSLERSKARAINTKKSENEILEDFFDYFMLYLETFRDMSRLDTLIEIINYIYEVCERNKLNNMSIISKLNENLNREIELAVENILSTIPFSDSSKKIGVYGIGKHTDGMFKLYRLFINDIQANLVFFDSFMDDQIYNGNKIINIKNINNFDLDCVAISSPSHEQELYNNIKKYMVKDIDIFTFYINI